MTRQNGGGSYDLLIVDSDGFGLRRIAGTGTQLYSPVWSPDGRRILYAQHGPRLAARRAGRAVRQPAHGQNPGGAAAAHAGRTRRTAGASR
jgi:Tol biopolymer transport system component